MLVQREGPRRKHHHHLAKFHLQEFSDAGGRVWQFDRRNETEPNPCLVSVRRAATTRDLYAPDVGDEPKSDKVERWLDRHVDGLAAPAFRRLLEGAILGPPQRSDVARYIMSLDLRTPKAQEFLLGISQDALDADFAAFWADPERVRRDLHADLTDEEIARIRATYRPEVAKPFWLHFMGEHLNRGAERLFHYRRWLVIRAPVGLEFVTSDLGIAKYRGNFGNPVPHMIGWWNQGAGWVVPLSPSLALALDPDPSPGPLEQGNANARAEFVESLNRTIVSQAHRFVYARRPHDFILASWRESA